MSEDGNDPGLSNMSSQFADMSKYVKWETMLST